MSENMQEWSESRRRLQEAEMEAARARFRHEWRAQYLSACMSIYTGAELGPMYAMLNLDPRAYGVAREAADRMQAIALKAITTQQSAGDGV